MVIANPTSRRFVAYGLGFVHEALGLVRIVLNIKARSVIKVNVSSHKPHNAFGIVRLLDDPPEARITEYPIKSQGDIIKRRGKIRTKDLKLPSEGWAKGKYYIEAHNSQHFHHDLSIVVNGKVYRMARTPSDANTKKGFLGILPGPGEKSGWILQPEHKPNEVPNPPVIEEGYGKGTCKVIASGDCLVNVSSDGNLHAMFDGIDGVYVFVERPEYDQVLIIRKVNQGPWLGKHIMKDGGKVDPYIEDDNFWFFEKKDGSAVEWEITKHGKGKRLRIWSWRPDANLEKKYGVRTQIEHTYRLKLTDKRLPDNIPVATGRGELWIKGEHGLTRLGSKLNSGLVKSRKHPDEVFLYIHDVTKFEGKDVSCLSYRDKLNLMEEIKAKSGRLRGPYGRHRISIPPYAKTARGKESLWHKARKEPGIDGVVAWRVDEEGCSLAGRPIKLKFKHLHENWHPATIVDIQPQRGEHGERFGFPILENKYRVQFKSSGLGLNEKMKADMLANPDKYIGREVRYSAEKHFESGTPFQPVIKEWDTV